MSTHRPASHKCEVCGKMLKSKETLSCHLLTHDTTNSKFVCKECGSKFNNKNQLDRHCRHDHALSKLACPKCSKMFFSRQDVHTHFQICGLDKSGGVYKLVDRLGIIACYWQNGPVIHRTPGATANSTLSSPSTNTASPPPSPTNSPPSKRPTPLQQIQSRRETISTMN